jgi:hypothetical protein
MRRTYSKLLTACLAMAMAMAAASARESAGRAAHERTLECQPTHFDYLVMASLADSGIWLGLSTYTLPTGVRKCRS